MNRVTSFTINIYYEDSPGEMHITFNRMSDQDHFYFCINSDDCIYADGTLDVHSVTELLQLFIGKEGPLLLNFWNQDISIMVRIIKDLNQIEIEFKDPDDCNSEIDYSSFITTAYTPEKRFIIFHRFNSLNPFMLKNCIQGDWFFRPTDTDYDVKVVYSPGFSSMKAAIRAASKLEEILKVFSKHPRDAAVYLNNGYIEYIIKIHSAN